MEREKEIMNRLKEFEENRNKNIQEIVSVFSSVYKPIGVGVQLADGFAYDLCRHMDSISRLLVEERYERS